MRRVLDRFGFVVREVPGHGLAYPSLYELSVHKDLPQREAMKSLPPLETAFTQLLFGFGLGNVYFTRLGGYDTYRLTPWFSDPSVRPLLETFQKNLRKTEQEIGRRNLSRIPYETLVPSAIPQSINI